MTSEQQGFEALKRAHNLVEMAKKLIGRQDGPILSVCLLESIAANPDGNKTWHKDHACPENASPAVTTAFAYLEKRKLIRRHKPERTDLKSVHYEITPAGSAWLGETMKIMPKIIASADYIALTGKSKAKKKGDNHNECSRCTCAG